MKKLIVAFFFTSIFGGIFSQGSGNSIQLNGLNQSINLGTNVATGLRTIEMWFKFNTTFNSSSAVVSTLIARDFNAGSGLSLNEFGIGFAQSSWTNPGKLFFFKRDGTTLKIIYSNQNSWNARQWYHVACVIDSVSGMKIYINGELQSDTDPSVIAIANQTGSITDEVHIGKWGNYNLRGFDGEIDEVRLWDVSRIQTEIRKKMCSKLKGTELGLKAYYKLDNLGGSQVLDFTSNSNNGILNNSPTRALSSAPIGDTSTYVHASSLASSSLTMASGAGDVFTIDAISASAKGLHIYRVDANPNSALGLQVSLLPNYYGVFLTGSSSGYRINYDYSSYACSNTDLLFERNDNSILSWSNLSSSPSLCNFNLPNQSRNGQFYRSEYIISLDSVSAIDTTLVSDTTKIDSCISQLIVPNVFSPNNDQLNDFFIPLKVKCLVDFNFKIYNRWGQIVYESFDSSFSWDGKYKNKSCSAGAYFWTATYKDEDKKTINVKGFLTLFN